jgi:DNA-binding NtrC family response regulator
MSLPMQAKLLRVLQDGEIRPVGRNQVIHVDARIVSATNRDLAAARPGGAVPRGPLLPPERGHDRSAPLRERRDDIPLLVDFFRERANFNMGKQVEGVAPSCLKLLQSYSWPGNVRELENAVERAVMFCQGRTITVADLSPEVRDYLSEMTTCPDEFDLSCNVRDTERKCIVRALQQTGGNRSQAAKLLGISRKRLWEKMKEMQVLID